MSGQGSGGLVDKVGAHLRACVLEVGAGNGLQPFLDSYVVWCTDMGVESGMPDFASADITQVLLHSDAQGDDEYEMPAALETNALSNLMPNAMLAPGVCHAIHNATKDLDRVCDSMEEFFSDN